MKIHFIPNEQVEKGHALCYINPKDLETLKEIDVTDKSNKYLINKQ